MARKQTVSLFLLVVLFVSTIAPVTFINLQLDLSISNMQGNISLVTTEAYAPATPNILACGGCSGGDVGPI